MRKTLLQWAEKHFGKFETDPQWTELVRHTDTRALIHSELIRIARVERLRSHEVPFGVIINPVPFMNDNRKVIRSDYQKRK
jgi:hypothetical protein